MPDKLTPRGKERDTFRTWSEARRFSHGASPSLIVNERYVPGLVRAIAKKLESDASRFYREHFRIGVSDWYILTALAGEVWYTPSVVGQKAGLDKAAVSRGITRLQEEGFVQRRDANTRSHTLALTTKGRRLYDRVARAARQREEQLLAALPPKEVSTLISLLAMLSRTTALLADQAPKAIGKSRTTITVTR